MIDLTIARQHALPVSSGTYERKANPVCQVLKFHCSNIGLKASMNVNISESLKPLNNESHNTIGSVKNIWNGLHQMRPISRMLNRFSFSSLGPHAFSPFFRRFFASWSSV